MTDDLTLIVGGQQIDGWTKCRVSRGVERFPSDFSLTLTEKYPDRSTQMTAVPGDACKIMIGNDTVITGYVDRVLPGFSPNGHEINIFGRSKCQDIVDCSAEWPNSQISNATALSLATKLAAPYGITVTDLSGSTTVIPSFTFMWGERAYDVIERACRYLQLLVYDDVQGNLVLGRIGTTKAASGFVEGPNVLRASPFFGMDQRYSTYTARLTSMSLADDIGNADSTLFSVYDKGVARHRLLYLIVEGGVAPYGNGQTLQQMRASWEMARRYGRSQQVRLTVDSWRDSGGVLWTPNTLAPVDLPSLKINKKTLAISDVTYRLDEGGTVADVVLMPPEAFQPMPEIIQPFFADLYNAGGPR